MKFYSNKNNYSNYKSWTLSQIKIKRNNPTTIKFLYGLIDMYFFHVDFMLINLTLDFGSHGQLVNDKE